jgi:RNA recognition motif-containing protein
VAFDTTQDAVQALFGKLGAIEFCRLVKDKSTGQSRGTAFIKFASAEDATAALKRASDPHAV